MTVIAVQGNASEPFPSAVTLQNDDDSTMRYVSAAAHDARVTELLEANNREVERRRTMAHALHDMIECYREDADKPVSHEPDVIKQAFDALAGDPFPSRLPGLPSDTTATAIGYSADGRAWVLRHVDNGGGLPDGPFWVAVGFDESTPPSPRATGLFGETEGFIVEHELVAAVVVIAAGEL